MANVYSIAFTVAGIVLAHCCLLVWTAMVLPAQVDRSRRRIESRPIFCFFIGLACCLLTATLMAVYSAIRARIVPHLDDLMEFLSVHLQFTRGYNDAWILTNALAWIFAIPVLAAFIFGGAGLAQIFGIRARVLMRDDRPLLGLTYGAFCSSVSYFLPLVGWFVYLPIVGLISIGGGICGMLGRTTPRGGENLSSSARRQEPALSNR
jgi:hypothetical protein